MADESDFKKVEPVREKEKKIRLDILYNMSQGAVAGERKDFTSFADVGRK